MIKLHKCKTVTAKEYNPSVHDKYSELLSFLKKSPHTLWQAREQLIQSAPRVKKRMLENSFSVAMKRNLFGLYTIGVFVNGKRCTFIIDTGAQISGVRAQVLEELHCDIAQGGVEIGSISGKRKLLKGACLKSLRFGSLIYEQLPVLCLDKDDFALKIGEFDLFGFDGILGWDILQDLDFEMDTIAKRFKVLKNIYKFTYENMVSGMFPVFLVEDSYGNLLSYGFDSGSKHSWINIEHALAYGYPEGDDMQAMGFGVHGMERLDLKMIDEIQLKLFKAQIQLRDVMSGNCQIDPDYAYDGVFGNEIFAGRRIRILNSKGMALLA